MMIAKMMANLYQSVGSPIATRDERMANPNPARQTLLHVFSTFAVGGPQTRFAQIANASGHSFRHLIFAADGRYDARALLKACPDDNIVASNGHGGNLAARIKLYRSRLRQLGPDLLVTYNWGAIEWALAARLDTLPHIHIEDGFRPDEVNRQLLRRVLFRRLALARSFAVIVPSRKLEEIARNTWKLAPHLIRYIPNGVSAGAPDVAAVRTAARDLGLEPRQGETVIGWLGALRWEKNVGRLVRAFAKLPPTARLVIVGEGPERAGIEELILTLNIGSRVRLLGAQNNIERLLPLFDILALSSDTEQMPVAVLEGMAAGLAIASVDVGDVAIMVARQNRPFIVARSDDALSDALKQLIDKPDMRRTIGAANRARVLAEFRADQMIDAYSALFAHAAAPRVGARPADVR
jgi:glycosyltransferase involved in cell wall biosynthesis